MILLLSPCIKPQVAVQVASYEPRSSSPLRLFSLFVLLFPAHIFSRITFMSLGRAFRRLLLRLVMTTEYSVAKLRHACCSSDVRSKNPRRPRCVRSLHYSPSLTEKPKKVLSGLGFRFYLNLTFSTTNFETTTRAEQPVPSVQVL